VEWDAAFVNEAAQMTHAGVQPCRKLLVCEQWRPGWQTGLVHVSCHGLLAWACDRRVDGRRPSSFHGPQPGLGRRGPRRESAARLTPSPGPQAPLSTVDWFGRQTPARAVAHCRPTCCPNQPDSSLRLDDVDRHLAQAAGADSLASRRPDGEDDRARQWPRPSRPPD
jgi:hypothetical protein